MDSLNSISVAVNLTPVVIGVISTLVLALVALGIALFAYCKSQNSFYELQTNRRKRRDVNRGAGRFKLPTSNEFYVSAARIPTFPQQQQHQQQPLYMTRSNSADINLGPRRHSPYYSPAARNNRFTAMGLASGAPMRAYERGNNAAEEMAVPMRGLTRAYVP